MSTIKTHIALKVADLNQSIQFYQTLFGITPVKHKPGYAKFDLAEPALNLTLNQRTTSPLGFAHAAQTPSSQSDGTLSHLGIQVDSTDSVQAAIARFNAAGLSIREEFNTDCCYALQDKVWVTDPDGNPWEIFVVHVEDTAPELSVERSAETPPNADPATAERRCCAPSCCA